MTEPTIHFPALHLSQAMLNGLVLRGIRHPDLDPVAATDLLLGHIASLHHDLTALMDGIEGKTFVQIDPDGISWQTTP